MSGLIKTQKEKTELPFVTLTLKRTHDSTLVSGTSTDENGQFTLVEIPAGEYLLTASYVGYQTRHQPISLDSWSPYLDLGTIELLENTPQLNEVVVSARSDFNWEIA